jgi:type IV pilus biogenesis protein CpaD/CtpE
MKRQVWAVLALTLSALALQACATAGNGEKSVADANAKAFDDFGRSVRQDLAAQVLEPNPAWKHARVSTDGHRACLAQKRYQLDAAPQPQLATTGAGEQLFSGGGVTTANLSAGCGGVPLATTVIQ